MLSALQCGSRADVKPPKRDRRQMDKTTLKVVGIIDSKVPDQVDADSDFSNIGLDSLAMAEIVCEVENDFGIKTDYEILEVQNVRELVEYINAQQTKAASAE